MTDLIQAMLSDVESVIKTGIGVAATLYVSAVWWKTKALVPTATAIVMAGVVVWATANVQFISDQIGEDSAEWTQGATDPEGYGN